MGPLGTNELGVNIPLPKFTIANNTGTSTTGWGNDQWLLDKLMYIDVHQQFVSYLVLKSHCLLWLITIII